MPRTILVTGFEPFGGEAINASWEAARKLDGWRCGGWGAAARMLPCAYDASVAEIVRAFEALRPEALLMTGQAARRGVICVERIARNRDTATAPDNRGVLRADVVPVLDAPERLETIAPAQAVARAIRDAGQRVRLSTDAGGYVCNHLYFGALQFLRGQSPGTPAVFLHLPATPEQTLARANKRRLAADDAARALKAAAAAIMGADATQREAAQ